jgi:D-alanyl-D-alanine carboxypeptidase
MRKIIKSKKFIIVFVVFSLLITATLIILFLNRNTPADHNQTSAVNSIQKPTQLPKKAPPKPSPTAVVTPSPLTWPVFLSNAQASSITVVVNKKHRLPQDYVPNLVAIYGGYLRPEAASALTSLFKASPYGLKSVSDYRSFSQQAAVYNNYVNRDGQAQADTYSARPGFSEHQTGLAVDIGSTSGTCSLETCFGNTPEGKWLSANVAIFGFIIRYPQGKETITGYQYEPWHLRYVGIDLAKAITASGKTLDEYFGAPAGDYQ